MRPDDCPNCRKVFQALVDRQVADPETPLTTVEIGKVVGLRKRATQDHLAHLFAHGRIDADRRTPLVSGIGQPMLPGAQEWAANVVAPDPTCAKCLIALAGWGWEGQVHMEELARAAGVSLRTIERHRPHLVNADLVVFRPVTVREANSGFVTGRRPDRFQLMSGLTAPRLEGAAWAEAPARAAAVIERVRWFVPADDDTSTFEEQRELAIQSVTWCLRNGWPEEDLLRTLDESENRNAYRPGGYLSKLLRKLPRDYVIPARQVVRGEAPERRVDCPICDRPFKTRLPGRVLCGGAVCLNPDEAVIPPGTRVFKIA
jgi:predicted ArsR family transcriptional regulator